MAKVLLTGASGYIGSELIQPLVDAGHEVVAIVRDKRRCSHPNVIEADFLKPNTLNAIPKDIDCAYYLLHGMGKSLRDFQKIEEEQVHNFIAALKETNVKQIIYLGGLVSGKMLSPHMSSRLNVEEIIKESGIPYTALRAGIIIGAGSASFEIIRNLVEKLPIMIAPKWLKSKCQPISIIDIIPLLVQVIGHPSCLNQTFDVGGPEQLTYKEILYSYAEVRGLTRAIISVPVLSPRLSSYWLYFITSTNFLLAMALVDSLKSDAICQDTRIRDLFPRNYLSFKESVAKSFEIEDTIPTDGCLIDLQEVEFEQPREEVIERIWSIGGTRGWYAMNWAWKLRGWLDELFGGVGLRRGRDHDDHIQEGDHLDFWRVEAADKDQGHLLLKAEMKVPGEAWLEFTVKESRLIQKATFRPKGLLGRAYWYFLIPMHLFVFKKMAQKIVSQ